MLYCNRDRAEQTAERKRAGVAHEDRGRWRVEPEESQPCAEHRAAKHGKLAGARDIIDLQIFGEHRVAGEVGDHAEACGSDHHRHDGEAIEAVGEVHRIAGADHDEGAEQHEEPAEIQRDIFEKRQCQRGRERRPAEPHQRVARRQRNYCLDQQTNAAGKAVMALLRHLQIIVVETDKAEAQRDREHDPDIGIERVGPQHGRDQYTGQDHQAAHGRRALLGHQMRLRAVGADRLALALAKAQMIDDPGTEQKHEQRCGHHRAAGAERDVAKYVERRSKRPQGRNGIGQIDQPVKHSVRPIPRLRRARSDRESAFPAH